MQEHISIVSITDNSVLIRFILLNSEKISYMLEPDNIHGSLDHANSIGRFEISGLEADKKYQAIITWSNKKRKINFSTLPKPEGETLCKYAIIGDPHISSKAENQFGRLHVESSLIMHSFISQINDLGLDFVLSTGDLTDNGSAEEYDLLEKAISLLNPPFLSVAGNHDFCYGAYSYERWLKYLGPLAWREKIKNIAITGLDTHERLFHTKANQNALENLQNKPFFIILSHYQLFEDEYILDADKVVSDQDAAIAELKKIKDQKGIIYVGHKNVPSYIYMGNLLQVNVPQTTHYPCGILVAHMHTNGIYHRFEPIFSEILNEYSRKELLTASKSQANPEYRDYKMSEKWNFVYSK